MSDKKDDEKYRAVGNDTTASDNPDTVDNLYKSPSKKDEKKDKKEKKKGFDYFKKCALVMEILCCIVFVLFLWSVIKTFVKMKSSNVKKDAVESLTNVSVKELKPETFELELSLNAELKSLTGVVSVYAPVSGTYTENLVKLGDRVKKGQELGRVDATDIGVSYNQAPVYAKADGVVTKIACSINDKVSAQTVMYTIEQDPDFVLDAAVSESDVESIEEGILGRFSTAGNSSLVHTGHLSYIAPSVNTSSRTVDIRLTVDNTEDNLKGLRSGNYVNLKLLKRQIKDALVVPRDALRLYNSGYAVFVVDGDNIARKRDVEVGDMDQSNAVITKGLNVGDKVVITGSPQDGNQVKVL